MSMPKPVEISAESAGFAPASYQYRWIERSIRGMDQFGSSPYTSSSPETLVEP